MQHEITEYNPTQNTITVVFNGEVTKTINVPLLETGEVDREALEVILQQQKRGIVNSRAAANTFAAVDGHTLVTSQKKDQDEAVEQDAKPPAPKTRKKKGT